MIRQKWLIFIFILGLSLPLSYVSAGTILSSYKYAWSNNAGYINFENVTVSDSVLSGYAWSANNGWIKFDPAQGGVLNDGTGNLSGSAWGESLGWIDFDGVSINASTGIFSGTATGALVGTITFDCSYCDVRTDWLQATTPPVVSSGSSGGGGYYLNPTPAPNPLTPTTTPPIQTPPLIIPKLNNTENPKLKTQEKLVQNPSLPLKDKSISAKVNKESAQQHTDVSSQTFIKSVSEKVGNFFKSIINVVVSFLGTLWRNIKLLIF